MPIENIEPVISGERLDKTVAQALNLSRSRIKELLEDDRILVNGSVEKPSYQVQEEDQIQVDLPEAEEVEILPEPMDLDIVYEDQDLVVVNKPKGLVVHPAPGHHTGTLVNGLLAHCQDLSGINGKLRPGIVHRIDKDTSGLLIICKNDHSHREIAKQLQDKTCHREYVALVHHPFDHDHGTINAPIGRDEKDRQKMAVTAKNSKSAITHFRVLKNYKDYALVSCLLETGRTHQIRVHMQYIGHPVVGDPKYGYRKTMDTQGQLLHAARIEFIHPSTREKITLDAPLDPIFAKVIEQLDKE
ncbi:RluA family pseudouridine synthase [Faecalicoccus acidiformans]|uniref:Pseudouridine synthase n=1 Tax=Faecalicoccus acidiformans TaxID=915173 RepID=A0ABS2FKW0_9FIRM|nr:RluA family pseudouridine synthase [Faecalicoccus acidiformans]MBM6830673.1 RluA family pseudouridine synthase [Faecalicoccus acidiformans]MDM8202915.1 RluA family pseudouridine synthase [Faecalicoccus acidiformans]HIW18456.1 RluA family pseudouridine synthase [Candidatus Faecalicoccus intestinipullorum]